MTVAELITRLQKAPNPQAPVRFSVNARESDLYAAVLHNKSDAVYLQDYRERSEIEL